MIAVKKFNKEEMVVNADMIESIEATPDTMICLTTGRKIPVRDSVEDVVKKVIRYKQLINQTIGIVPKEERNKPQN
jgi:flagellar protein FlbD